MVRNLTSLRAKRSKQEGGSEGVGVPPYSLSLDEGYSKRPLNLLTVSPLLASHTLPFNINLDKVYAKRPLGFPLFLPSYV